MIIMSNLGFLDMGDTMVLSENSYNVALLMKSKMAAIQSPSFMKTFTTYERNMIDE